MGQLTPEERRRIGLNKQRASLDLIERLSASLPASKPLARRPRFRKFCEMVVIALLLTAGWFVSRVVELHPPTSIGDIVPRL
jgi:hypothetical protein